MFNNVYAGKKVLVTGHTGFKGSWLTAWLLKMGARVAGYSNGIPTNPSHFEDLQLASRIQHIIGDVRDYDALSAACDDFQPEFIFHLAAQPLVRYSYENPRETFEVNMLGTLNVLEWIRKSGASVKVAVMITSDKCYDNVEWLYGYREDDRLGGEDPYSGSKGAAELIAKSYIKSFFGKAGGPRVATVRAGNVIGGGDWALDRIVPDIIRSWLKDKKVEIRNPLSTRPWQHVLEPLSGYLCLGAELYVSETHAGEPFNFGPDSKVNKNVGELIGEMERSWPAAPGWVNTGNPADFRKESNLLKLCCDKANILLKWYPTLDFEETIVFTTEWFRRYHARKGSIYDLTMEQIEHYIQTAKNKGIAWAEQ
ncbi:MAG TPA: CDP-glucose 4,6-dehydratase [Dinghuibacter sp.]|jgi:CDP-glucose 4,6-dehydratase|uniref:CDP-glucose 4,6-dehydratase n=1 Tax=Dinghuibacter sp. TaxID=2024697 RepID=UPI002CC804D0|nr:CDP-glucose 4,6-dehydratase [Dinghuibacter sp.]HTJ10969.1 CDP-glucose 4,6-dehydratase [Dinghuibacter sp.]